MRRYSRLALSLAVPACLALAGAPVPSALAAPAAAAADAAAADPALAALLANAAREPRFVARDSVRHPVEELSFFGL
ncbi:MAG: hypothetical protein JSR54_20245, partial [Proteobacteria bacterium]|nr:hypothetical protein [Pseudomonadota bacterium]